MTTYKHEYDAYTIMPRYKSTMSRPLLTDRHQFRRVVDAVACPGYLSHPSYDPSAWMHDLGSNQLTAKGTYLSGVDNQWAGQRRGSLCSHAW